MKWFKIRLLFANILLVVAALVFTVFLLGRLVPALADTADALLPTLIVLVCACSFVFALVEAFSIYRHSKAVAKKAASAAHISEQ